MHNYIKTQFGKQVLQQRSLKLNASQRRTLLLIDSDHFHQLEATAKTRLAPPEILAQLLAQELIMPNMPTQHDADSQQIILTPSSEEPPSASITTHSIHTHTHAQHSFDAEPDMMCLSFEDIQWLMIQSLHQYCGLIARPLIEKIQHCHNLQHIKYCQIQWLTVLKESHINPTELQQLLTQLNLALKKIDHPTLT